MTEIFQRKNTGEKDEVITGQANVLLAQCLTVVFCHNIMVWS